MPDLHAIAKSIRDFVAQAGKRLTDRFGCLDVADDAYKVLGPLRLALREAARLTRGGKVYSSRSDVPLWARREEHAIATAVLLVAGVLVEAGKRVESAQLLSLAEYMDGLASQMDAERREAEDAQRKADETNKRIAKEKGMTLVQFLADPTCLHIEPPLPQPWYGTEAARARQDLDWGLSFAVAGSLGALSDLAAFTQAVPELDLDRFDWTEEEDQVFLLWRQKEPSERARMAADLRAKYQARDRVPTDSGRTFLSPARCILLLGLPDTLNDRQKRHQFEKIRERCKWMRRDNNGDIDAADWLKVCDLMRTAPDVDSLPGKDPSKDEINADAAAIRAENLNKRRGQSSG